jgi:uncharacterized protein
VTRRTIEIEVVYALPERQYVVALTLPSGATVADALAAVAHDAPFASLPLAEIPVGVFGEPVARSQLLNHGDRVELYRPLVIDPKEARRRRAQG